MITAKIEKDKMGYWMLIDHQDDLENVAWPITKDEIKPIMEACKEWLKGNK